MKYDCCLIQDTLPLYKDGVLSEKSSTLVAGHLQECAVCRRLFEECTTQEAPVTAAESDVAITNTAKRYSQRIKLFRIWISIGVVFLLIVGAGMGLFFGKVGRMEDSMLAAHVDFPTATWFVRSGGMYGESFVTLSGSRAVDAFVDELEGKRFPMGNGYDIVVHFASNCGRQYGLFTRFAVSFDIVESTA